MKKYPVYKLKKRKKQSNAPIVILAIASLFVVYSVGHVDNSPSKQSHAQKLTITKPVKLVNEFGEELPKKKIALFIPKNEQERQKVIASIWNLKGKQHETEIFTARGD